MNSNSIYRERFASTLEHKSVDRCPIDLAGTPQAMIEDPRLTVGLARLLGYEGGAPTDYDKCDWRILQHLDIDFRAAGSLVWFDTGRQQAISDIENVDCYGIRRRFSGTYWEIVESPLAGSTKDDILAWDFPNLSQVPWADLEDWAARVKVLYEETPYVVVGEHPVLGVLELACWLCGYEHIMMQMALDPEYVHILFGKILEMQKSVIREYYTRMGKYIHLTTSGDDFGTQRGLFMSPDMWREFVKPYFKERIAYTAQFTDAVYMHHSCGSVFEIIPDLIEIGVRILNPIQTTAVGMDPKRLKEAYGDRIVYHGGLDTQEVLPSDDPEKIDAAVMELLNVMDPQNTGGYIFAPAHVLQKDVSPRSVARMYQTAIAAQRK